MTARDRLLERMHQGRVSLLTSSDVALLFSVNRKTVASWANVGRLPCLRTLGGHRRFPTKAILAALEPAGEQ